MTNTNSFLTAKSQHIVREGVQFGKAVTGTLIVTDLDGLINGDISVLGLPPGGEFKITSVLLEPLGKTAHVQWSYTHTDPNFSGWANALIKVVDDKGVSSSHHVQVDVPAVSQPPYNPPSYATAGYEGKGTVGSIITNDLDVGDLNGIDHPNFQLFAQTGQGNFDINPTTGVWTYSSSTVGKEVIHVKVTDNLGAVSTVGITVTTDPLSYVA